MRFIGIDLAWTYKNETGICVIDENGRVEYLDAALFSDDDIVSIIEGYSDEQLYIGIDAPLIIKNTNGSRGAEGELMKTPIHGKYLRAFNVNQDYMNKVYGQMRGVALAEKLQSRLENIQFYVDGDSSNHLLMETFPTGNICGLFPELYPVKYKLNRKIHFEETVHEMLRLLERLKLIEIFEKKISGFAKYMDYDHLSINKKHYKNLEDKVDAFLCAYGMYAGVKGDAEFRNFGDSVKGFITISALNDEKAKEIKAVYRVE